MLVEPNKQLPYFLQLKQILAYAGGAVLIVGETLGHFDSIQEAFIFGSWAERFSGIGGQSPNDMDIAIVSDTLTLVDLAEAIGEIEKQAGTQVYLHVLAPNNPVIERYRQPKYSGDLKN
jgi:predicted nucleotidyltransferase